MESDIVELKAPSELGWPGTAKFSKSADATLIAELKRRGYTVVNE